MYTSSTQHVENPKKSSGDTLKKTFAEILPDYDRDAVYVSDIKKIFTWFNLLLEKDLLDFSEDEEADSTEEKKEETTEEDKSEEKK